MAKEESCECAECQKQLTECKEKHCKLCEEKSKEQSIKISLLEKKIMTMTIIGAIAITLIGKELVDKVIASFQQVEKVQQLVEPQEKKETSEVSTSYNFPSSTFC